MNTLIIEDWRREGIPLNGPASEAEIAACEAELQFRFPADFRHLYSVCNGFAEWQMDTKLLSLWPLKMIRFENHKPGFIAFADYLANGSQIGYIASWPGVYHDYNRDKFCDSFDEFIDHWRRDSGMFI
ncbi:MAG: hypothetical protein EOP49_16435 [Sphingobacteriales bacterium]|nr:MAG: hypothetical protein EOP49_16435 [Sphingobacteriales bacterium]